MSLRSIRDQQAAEYASFGDPFPDPYWNDWFDLADALAPIARDMMALAAFRGIADGEGEVGKRLGRVGFADRAGGPADPSHSAVSRPSGAHPSRKERKVA